MNALNYIPEPGHRLPEASFEVLGVLSVVPCFSYVMWPDPENHDSYRPPRGSVFVGGQIDPYDYAEDNELVWEEDTRVGWTGADGREYVVFVLYVPMAVPYESRRSVKVCAVFDGDAQGRPLVVPWPRPGY